MEHHPKPMDPIYNLRNAMVSLRNADRYATSMAERGRFAFYHPVRGREATYCGVAFGLQDGDWIFWGPQVPDGGFLPVLTPHSLTTPNAPSPGAARLVHATGVAMAITAKNHERMVGVVFGEGLSDSADFHVALNFAAVYNAPVLFVALVERPGSEPTPAHLQHTMEGYGIPSYEVDGTCAQTVQELVGTITAEKRLNRGPAMIVARIDPTGDPETPLQKIQTKLQQTPEFDAERDAETIAELEKSGFELVIRSLTSGGTDKSP